MPDDNRFDFFCSWSGGKDSCLALYRMCNAGHRCRTLFTMIDECGIHSRSHGLTVVTLEAQADGMDLPIRAGRASWDSYEYEFREHASRLRREGINHGVFGDIDLDPHRDWVERVCAEAGITAHEPLWKGKRSALVREFIEAGFRARIVVINTELMPGRFLGREIDMFLVGELEALGIDACGENGEYHSFVYDGPLFRHSLDMTDYRSAENDGYVFLHFVVCSGKVNPV
ncbi:MAG: diphthine--ammonia ligase [Chitinispirillaceae bacterium]|nr:diphthine--ammonia ligase [Chitinispirillaceae bacterium]